MPELHLIEEVEEETDIDWWTTNRKKLNSVIRLFNEWQTLYRFDEFEGKVVLAKINAQRKHVSSHAFSEWQIEMLDEIEKHVKSVLFGA